MRTATATARIRMLGDAHVLADRDPFAVDLPEPMTKIPKWPISDDARRMYRCSALPCAGRVACGLGRCPGAITTAADRW